MHEALVFACSFKFFGAAGDGPTLRQLLSTLLADPQLLAWYTKELLRNIRDDCVHNAQVGSSAGLFVCPACSAGHPLRMIAVNNMALAAFHAGW